MSANDARLLHAAIKAKLWATAAHDDKMTPETLQALYKADIDLQELKRRIREDSSGGPDHAEAGACTGS